MNTLKRHLGVGGATLVGLSAMIGAGVFYVWAPAAQVAGSGLLIGLVVAATLATLNALSSTQLAMAYPVSGGAYAFGRATLGPGWGFAAGWMFLAGKTASAGALALIAGSYLWPEQARMVAVGAVVLLAAVNAAGIRSTARVSTVVVIIVIGGLLAVIGAVISGPAGTAGVLNQTMSLTTMTDAGATGMLQAAGLLFFCFAGYARMATLGEEVRDPQRTLPRAILVALGVALLLYFTIAVLLVSVLGPERLAGSSSPITDLIQASGGGLPGDVVVRLVAAVACLGSLMGILAGLSRTGLAMARKHDLPGPLGRISVRTGAPVVAETSMALVAIVGILLLDPARLVGFSACTVLVYYAIAHLAAHRQPPAERWLPRGLQWVGMAGCLVLAVTLPWPSVVGAAGWLLLGLLLRGIRLRTDARAAVSPQA